MFLQLSNVKFHIVGWVENPRVDGSIPSQATNPNPSNRNVARVFCFHKQKPITLMVEESDSDF